MADAMFAADDCICSCLPWIASSCPTAACFCNMWDSHPGLLSQESCNFCSQLLFSGSKSETECPICHFFSWNTMELCRSFNVPTLLGTTSPIASTYSQSMLCIGASAPRQQSDVFCNLKLPASMLTRCIWALLAVKIEDSGREYKTYRGLRADLEPPELKNRPGRSIHLFLGSNNWTPLSGHLNPDGTYAGTLAMKNGGQHFNQSTNLHILS